MDIFQEKYSAPWTFNNSCISEREFSPSYFVQSFVYAIKESFLHQSQLIRMETTLLKDVREDRSVLKISCFLDNAVTVWIVAL